MTSTCSRASSLGLRARLAVLGWNELHRQLGEGHRFSLDRQLAELGVEDLLEVVTAGVGQLIAQAFKLLRWQVGAAQLGQFVVNLALHDLDGRAFDDAQLAPVEGIESA